MAWSTPERPEWRTGCGVSTQRPHARPTWVPAALDGSAEASARALLRTGAVHPRIIEALDAAAEAPDGAPPDLVAAALDHAIGRGLDDPAAHLEAEQAHPTDTHPPTRDRVAALGQSIDADLLATASLVPPPHALGQLAAYFADPTALCRAATADFLDAVRTHDAAFRAHLEATAAEVDGDERVLRENSRPGAIFLVAGGGFFGVTALVLAVLGFPGLPPGQVWIVVAVALACGVMLAGLGTYRLRQGERITMVLRSDGLEVPGLDRVIRWDTVADLDVTANQTGMVTRLLLPPEVPFPQRAPGGRGLKLDPKRRIVTIALGLPRNMKPQEFADLIGRYQAAAQARRILAETAATPFPPNPIIL